MSLRNLPPLHTGDSEFPYIRNGRGVYVDKTPYFRDLLEVNPSLHPAAVPALTNTIQFLARPRRFGKSLLISTLETWFQGLPPDHGLAQPSSGRALPQAPAGWSNPAWLWEGLDGAAWQGTHGWRPVIRLDMMGKGDMDPRALARRLRNYLMLVAHTWAMRGVPLVGMGDVTAGGDAAPDEILRLLIHCLHNHYGQEPVVLVDEYDAPLTDFIGTRHDPTPALAIMGKLYGVLKEARLHLYGVFLTGISRFSHVNLFSGLNNLVDQSHEPALAAVCGFTDAEVSVSLAPHLQRLQELAPALAGRNLQAELSAFYNGYRFSPASSVPTVYNPYTLLECLRLVLRREVERTQAVTQGQWPTVWSRSGNPAFLIRLVSARAYRMPSDTMNLDPHSDIVTYDLQHPNHTALMLQTGYYTWKGGGEAPLRLDFPNQEVRGTYAQQLLDTYRPAHDPAALPRMQKALYAGNVVAFADTLQTYCRRIAYENLDSESSFRTLLQCLLINLAPYSAAEKHTLSGRCDHEIHVGAYIYVMEAKYRQSVETAWQQLKSRGYGLEHRDGDRWVVGVALALQPGGKDETPACLTQYSEILYTPPADDQKPDLTSHSYPDHC